MESTLVGFKITILSQQLSPSGSGLHCSQPPCIGSRKHVPCYTGSWWSPGRHTSQESGFSVYLPEKLKSAFLCHSSAFQASPTNMCLVQQVLAIPSSISFDTCPSGRFPTQSPLSYSSFFLTTDQHGCPLHYSLHSCVSSWMLPLQTTWLHLSLSRGRPAPLLFQTALILNAYLELPM